MRATQQLFDRSCRSRRPALYRSTSPGVCPSSMRAQQYIISPISRPGQSFPLQATPAIPPFPVAYISSSDRPSDPFYTKPSPALPRLNLPSPTTLLACTRPSPSVPTISATDTHLDTHPRSALTITAHQLRVLFRLTLSRGPCGSLSLRTTMLSALSSTPHTFFNGPSCSYDSSSQFLPIVPHLTPSAMHSKFPGSGMSLIAH